MEIIKANWPSSDEALLEDAQAKSVVEALKEPASAVPEGTPEENAANAIFAEAVHAERYGMNLMDKAESGAVDDDRTVEDTFDNSEIDGYL